MLGYASDEEAASDARRVIELIGGSCMTVRADVSDADGVDSLFAAATTAGRLTAVVNNAGTTLHVGPLAETPIDVIIRVIEVNLNGAVLVARAAVRALGRSYGGDGGVLVNVSSAAATRGAAGEYVHYAAAKAGSTRSRSAWPKRSPPTACAWSAWHRAPCGRASTAMPVTPADPTESPGRPRWDASPSRARSPKPSLGCSAMPPRSSLAPPCASPAVADRADHAPRPSVMMATPAKRSVPDAVPRLCGADGKERSCRTSGPRCWWSAVDSRGCRVRCSWPGTASHASSSNATPTLLIHPRLRAVLPRTVELFRQVGLEPAIRAAISLDGGRSAWAPVRAETLASDNYATIEEGSEDDSLMDASPSPFAAIDQDKLELLLRDRARELGAEARFSTELTSFEQHADGVDAVLEDRRTGAKHAVQAQYLIAADGDASPLRRQLGVDVDGPGPLSHQVTAVVDADLRPALRGRQVSIAYLQQPQPFTVLLAHDTAGQRWAFGTRFSPEHESIDDYGDERVADMIRAAAGLPDAEVTLRPQIPGTDRKVLGFTIGAQVARQYRAGRVFLVGDAAHVVPPTGGLGGNTGIQDTHNLAWKLAAVLSGGAGPSLLDTYHTERHPIGVFTMRQALARFGARMGYSETDEPLVDYTAVAYGYQYRSTAVVGAGKDTTPLAPAELRGQPGTAPRTARLPTTGARSPPSTCTESASCCSPEATRSPGRQPPNVSPMTSVCRSTPIGSVSISLAPMWPPRTESDPSGALLVRPDGFVAWRSPHPVAEPANAVERALRSILAREQFEPVA